MELFKTGATITIMSLVLCCVDASFDSFFCCSVSCFIWLNAFETKDHEKTIKKEYEVYFQTAHSMGVILFGIFENSIAFPWSCGFYTVYGLYLMCSSEKGSMMNQFFLLSATVIYGKTETRSPVFWFICVITELSNLTVHLTTYYKYKTKSMSLEKWDNTKFIVRIHLFVYFAIRVVYGTQILIFTCKISVTDNSEKDYFLVFVLFFYFSGLFSWIFNFVNVFLVVFTEILINQ